MSESTYLSGICMGCMEPTDEEESVCPHCGYIAGTDNAPSYLPVGTVIGERYVVGKMLRFNGESAEYIGMDAKTRSKVIIHEYLPDTLCRRSDNGISISVAKNNVATYKAFMSEFVELNKSLAKMRTLNHINAPIAMFGENNTGYVIFRYIDGQNLRRFFMGKKDVISWNDAKELFSPLFTTLSLVHNAGVIHGGVSPENIIISENGEPVIIGFCIADARTAGTQLDAELYPGYSAPEQYTTSMRQGTQTDVYGICAVLYRILTGVVPSPAPQRERDDDLVPPHELDPTIPREVSSVIMKGLNISQDKRIHNITELVTELFDDQSFRAKREEHSGGHSERSHERAHTHTSHQQEEEKPAHGRFFGLALALAAIGVGVIMGVVMMALDDNSSNGLKGMQSTVTTVELPSETTAPPASLEETTTTMPTLAVVESAEEETTTQRSTDGTVYVMNDLTGKPYELIRDTAVMNTLNVIPDYVYTDEVPKGQIFAQSIEKGGNYHKGDDCIISISMGPSKVAVPEFTGLSKRDYLEKLNKAGIKYEEKYYETNSVFNGYVADVSIAPGDYIDLEKGEVLEVFIAYNVQATTTEEVVTTIVTIPPEELETEPPIQSEPMIISEPEFQEITEPEPFEPEWDELPPQDEGEFFEEIYEITE